MGVKTMRLEESGVTTDSYKLQQPEHIVSLATSSMLVSVDINVWTATKQDRGISDEVATMKKQSWVQRKLPSICLPEILNTTGL